ncbi:MAG: hypothetical protein GX629_00800 [Phycisphaerae bacterium]|nr:hypothetical protein [Phycisphaerae bacterium]
MTYKRISNNKTGLLLLGLSSFIILGGLMILPYAVNYYFSPDQLIGSITQSIEELTGTEIRIGSSKLSLIEGVTFRDVRVLVPKDKLAGVPEFTEDNGLLLRASKFHVKLRRTGFLGLRFRLGMITVDQPEFYFTQVASNNLWNWQTMLINPGSKAGEPRQLNISPPIVLNDGKIVLSRIEGKERSTLGEYFFSAQATPQNHKDFYRIHLKTWTPKVQGPTIDLDVEQKDFRIRSGSMSSIGLDDLQANLPESIKTWSKPLHLSGNIRVSDFAYIPSESPRIVLMLDGVKGKVPTTRNELASSSETAFFNLSDLAGKVILENERIIIPKLTGLLNGAKCQIEGELRSGFNAEGIPDFTLTAACEGFDCPNYTDPKVQEYIETNIPWKIRCFFHDFKPIGKLDFNLAVDSNPQRSPAVTISGLIEPRRLSAEYFKFPYRVDEITGKVKITDGQFELVQVEGKTGPGDVLVNGTISEASKYAEIDLDITSRQTPLNSDLLAALPERYKAIFTQFNPSGFADTRIRLYQPYGEDQPWKTDITARLFETSATYRAFPYTIDHLGGTLVLKNNLLKLNNITGRHGSAHLTLAGSVDRINTPNPDVQLEIFTKNVCIDEDLVKVLPESTRKMVDDCNLKGKAEIRGEIVKRPNTALEYRFDCTLSDGSVCYHDFPYPIDGLAGQFIVAPGSVQIKQFVSAHDSRKILAAGTVDLTRDPAGFSLKIDAKNVPVDSMLRSALGKEHRSLWDDFSPTGRIDAKIDLTKKDDQPLNWRVLIELLKNSANYKGISPVTALTGQVTISQGQTLLKGITGVCEGRFPLRLDAAIDHDPQKTTIGFKNFQAQRIAVTEKLLSVLGENGGSVLKCEPGGAIRCSLSNVKIELTPEKLYGWELEGKVELDQVRMDFFDPSAPINLEYVGRLSQLTADSKFAVEGSLNVQTFKWNDRRMENFRAYLTKTINEPIMIVDPFRAQYANGEILGMGKIQFIGPKTTYGLQLTLDNIDAADALGLDVTENTISGKMSGEIFLVGTFGDKSNQVGGGILHVFGAEVLKVPMMAQIHRSVSKEPPNLASFHDITAEFSLEKYLLKIQHVEMVGPAISLIGQGHINISNDRIKVDLISGTPKKLQNLPVLPELMQGAAQEISEIEIRGTIQKPTISAKPLKNISDTLKTFFDGKAVK